MVKDDTLKSIIDYAKNNGIKTHIDGARIFVQAVHTGITPAQYGAMADTIYTFCLENALMPHQELY
jgi:threonine aldolase